MAKKKKEPEVEAEANELDQADSSTDATQAEGADSQADTDVGSSEEADPDLERYEHHVKIDDGTLGGLKIEEIHDALRDTILNWFKSPDVKKWSERKEDEQRSLASDVSFAVREMIKDTAKAVAGHGFDCLPGKVEQVTVKDKIKIVIETENSDENYESAGHVRGRFVTIVNADFSDFVQSQKEAEIDKDQPDMLDEAKGVVADTAEAIRDQWAKDDAEAEAEAQGGEEVGTEEGQEQK